MPPTALEMLAALQDEWAPAPPNAYLHPSLVRCNLPVRKSTDPVHRRVDGFFTLELQASPGKTLPAGKYARLIMLWLCTAAVQRKSRTIEIPGPSWLLPEMGLPINGRTQGEIDDQLRRLFGCTFFITVKKSEFRFQCFESIDDRLVVLDTGFYDGLLQSAVPLYWEVISKMGKNCYAMDLYCWLKYRTHKEKDISFIKWEYLREHFVLNYPDDSRGLRNVRIKISKGIERVKEHAPDIRVRIEKAGIRIKRSS